MSILIPITSVFFNLDFLPYIEFNNEKIVSATPLKSLHEI